jgi:molybdenum cofactor cytidylyltransferase
MAEIPILLLSAGASRRMGRAKQLLPWGQHTLIEHQVRILTSTGNPVLVVLGHQAEQVMPLLKKYPVRTGLNKQWKKGMGSSISCGIGELDKMFPGAAGALITQLDQPLIKASHFIKMLAEFEPGKNQIIVSSSTRGWEGVPVLFDRSYFPELRALRDEKGARRIFRSRPDHVKFLESSDLLDDMDTPEAYEKLLATYRNQ